MGLSSPQPGIKLMPSALDSRVLTTVLLRKSPISPGTPKMFFFFKKKFLNQSIMFVQKSAH